MRTLSFFACLICFFCLNQSEAQKKSRIQPGKMYTAGETLFAPRFGFIAKIPEGWEGMLPRENEVFLLTTTTSTYGEIYVFGREEGNLPVMAEAWSKGFNLSETIKLKAAKPVITDGTLSSEVVAEGPYINKGNKGFAITRCSQSGPCITVFMVAPVQFFESVKNTVIQFMSNSTFEPPSAANLYTDFDWTEFLSGKLVATYSTVMGGTKETMIHLCTDGTFQAKVEKGGVLKNQNPKYKGNLKGKWIVTGTGQEALIRLTFDKESLEPLEALLKLEDEKIYSNSERYFVGKSDKCK
jgi:hypothetical protein